MVAESEASRSRPESTVDDCCRTRVFARYVMAQFDENFAVIVNYLSRKI